MRTSFAELMSVMSLTGALVSMAPSAQGQSGEADRHLVLLLHLDDRGAAADASGEDTPVTVDGASGTVSGRFGRAFRFDGVDDFIRADETYCFSSQTIELWVRASGDAQGGIMSSQVQPGASHWRWRLARNADGTVSFHLHDNSMAPEPVRVARSTARLKAGVWTHVAVTVDTGQAREAVLYVNGRREAAATVHEHQPYGSLFLGTSTTEGYFAGDIDEVVIFDRAFAADVIAQHAASAEPFEAYGATAPGPFVLRPVGDTAWFTFRHKRFGRSRWIFRMPEYMYYDEKSARNRTPYGVDWAVNPSRTELRFRCGLPAEVKQELGLDFDGVITAGDDAIDYTLTVRNVGTERWERQRMLLFCLQCYRAAGMRDYEALRTFVRKDGQWLTMNDVVEGEFKSHRMCGVHVTEADGNGYERIAARVTEDGGTVLGIATDIASSLSFNFQDRIACLHSNPHWGLLKPGEERIAKGRIYLLSGTLDDLWRRYTADFPAASGR